jgi:serine/threonine protein kinase HipA of HipAB toxin-antitoxin module
MNARDEVIRRSRLSPGRPEYVRFTEALDAYRAEVLREAADFLRDAHFTDGLSVQEIGAALRYMANDCS